MILMNVMTEGMEAVLKHLAASTPKVPFTVNALADLKLKMELPLVAMTTEFNAQMAVIVIRMLSVSRKLG